MDKQNARKTFFLQKRKSYFCRINVWRGWERFLSSTGQQHMKFTTGTTIEKLNFYFSLRCDRRMAKWELTNTNAVPYIHRVIVCVRMAVCVFNSMLRRRWRLQLATYCDIDGCVFYFWIGTHNIVWERMNWMWAQDRDNHVVSMAHTASIHEWFINGTERNGWRQRTIYRDDKTTMSVCVCECVYAWFHQLHELDRSEYQRRREMHQV